MESTAVGVVCSGEVRIVGIRTLPVELALPDSPLTQCRRRTVGLRAETHQGAGLGDLGPFESHAGVCASMGHAKAFLVVGKRLRYESRVGLE